MAKHMGSHVLARERGTPAGGGGRVFGNEALDGVAAERGTTVTGEDDIGGSAVSLGEPGAHDSRRLSRERCAPLLPTLAMTTDVRTDSEHEVFDPQPGELGNT